MHSAYSMHSHFMNGEITASKIVDTSLKAIEMREPQVQAFLKILADRAKQKAEELDAKRAAGKPLGKLAGIPMAIKDNIHIRGEITTNGSKFCTNYKAPFDATVVRLLEAEDAILIGKTNLDEFGMGSSSENSAFQLSKNPWNLKCSPGGSSAGSAAAVAARMCPIAFGSDTGGSIRQPSAFCGLAGLKPTYGRVSRYGLVAYGSSLDTIGPFATNVKDLALIMEVIGRHCDRDSTSLNIPPEHHIKTLETPLTGKTIGVPKSFLEGMEGETKENYEESLKRLVSLGVNLVEVDLSIFKYALATYYILSTAEASTNLARFDGIRYGVRSEKAQTLDEIYDYSREDGFGAEVKRRIILGTYVLSSGHKEAFYKKAQQARALFLRQLAETFSKCDLVALPTTPKPTFELGTIHSPLEMYFQDAFTTPANLAGIPGISVLSGFSKENKPLALQLLGPHLSENKLLNCAYQFEQSVDLWKRTPYDEVRA